MQFSTFRPFCVLPSTLWKCMLKRSISAVSAAIPMARSGTWKGTQRTVARPSSARVAVPTPVELLYSPTSTALATRSQQSTGKGEEMMAQESVAVGRISNETSKKPLVQRERRNNREKNKTWKRETFGKASSAGKGFTSVSPSCPFFLPPNWKSQLPAFSSREMLDCWRVKFYHEIVPHLKSQIYI